VKGTEDKALWEFCGTQHDPALTELEGPPTTIYRNRESGQNLDQTSAKYYMHCVGIRNDMIEVHYGFDWSLYN
jgi:hypothetical protein